MVSRLLARKSSPDRVPAWGRAKLGAVADHSMHVAEASGRTPPAAGDSVSGWSEIATTFSCESRIRSRALMAPPRIAWLLVAGAAWLAGCSGLAEASGNPLARLHAVPAGAAAKSAALAGLVPAKPMSRPPSV